MLPTESDETMPEYTLWARDVDFLERGGWYRVGATCEDAATAEWRKHEFERDTREQGLARESEVRMTY